MSRILSPIPMSVHRDPNTILLLHGDGVDGSNVFVDSTGKTVTAHGSSHIVNTGTFPLTPDGGAMRFNGTSTDYASTPNSPDWNFGSNDFTMEAWLRLDVQIPYNAHYPIVARYRSPSDNFLFSVYNHQNYQLHIYWYGNVGGSNWNRRIELPWGSMLPDIWYHVAIVKNGSTIRAFLNGVGGMNNPSLTLGVPTITEDVQVGGMVPWNAYFNGSIDELRVSSVARYTDNFTPQTTPFNG